MQWSKIKSKSVGGFLSARRSYKPGQTTCIYALVDPRNGEVRYVGKSDYPKSRLSNAILEAKNGFDGPKHRWVRSVLAAGLEPRQEVLEEVPALNWQDAEHKWIVAMLRRGQRLTNTHAGEKVGGLLPGVTRNSDATLSIDYDVLFKSVA